MKKIISFLLVFSVFISSFILSVPVSASETTGEYFDVLDYVGVNGTTSQSVVVSGATEIAFDLSLFLGSFSAYGFEITFTCDSSSNILRSIDFDNSSASLRGGLTADGVYIYRGNFEGVSGSIFNLLFSSSSSVTVNFVSFNVYTVPTSFEPIGGTIYSLENSASFSAGNGAFIIVTAYSPTVEIRFDNWRDYNYIEFHAGVFCDDIDSITCLLRSNISNISDFSLSFDITPFSAESTSTFSRDFVIRVDLTDINHITAPDSTVVLTFDFSSLPDQSSIFHVYSANGVFFRGQSDPAYKWYQVIWNEIKSGFINLENAIFNFSDSVSGLFDSWFNSLFDRLDQYFGDNDDLQEESDATMDEFDSSMQEFNDFNYMFQLPDEQINFSIEIPNLNTGYSLFLSRLYSLPIVQSCIIFGFSIGLLGFVLFGKR